IAEVLEGRAVDHHVAWHAVPLEGLHKALRRRDLPVASLEAVGAVRGVLDEAPVTAALDLHPLDDELVAPAHHCATSLGSVNARQTRSRGALKIRSILISRSEGVVTVA